MGRLGADALIERREFKYLLPTEAVAGVRDAIRPFCELDRHAVHAPEHRYVIESLYFDTPDYALFHANEVELKDRIKLRVRHYPGADTGKVFFEVKRRYHDVILKTRGTVPNAHWQRLLTDPFFPRDLLGDQPGVERFVALAHTHHARPTSLVRYHREAWASVVDDYARVTFDTRIQAQPTECLGFDHDPRAWRALDDAENFGNHTSQVVLELKFTTHAPSWMMHLIQRLNLWRRAFSKYGSAIRTVLYPPPPRRLPSPHLRAWRPSAHREVPTR